MPVVRKTSSETTSPATSCPRNGVRQADRLAGLWASELLDLIGLAAQDYVHDLARTHAHPPSDQPGLLRRLTQDLRGRAAMREIRARMGQAWHDCRRHGPPGLDG